MTCPYCGAFDSAITTISYETFLCRMCGTYFSFDDYREMLEEGGEQ